MKSGSGDAILRLVATKGFVTGYLNILVLGRGGCSEHAQVVLSLVGAETCPRFGIKIPRPALS